MRDFNYTVNVLVQAYINNTLKHGDCNKCAVGNILRTGKWRLFFITPNKDNEPIKQIIAGPNQFIDCFFDLCDAYTDEENWEIKLDRKKIENESGYTIPELARIENAFETANQGNNEDDYMFNGLMAVVDVLAEIHGINLKEKESAKLLFAK